MTTNTMKVGDVVCLKGGGPAMTVIASDSSKEFGISCVWFDGKEVRSAGFPAGALAPVEPKSRTTSMFIE